MIPILYNSKETDFTHNGIGFLKDCISCVVTEERNGIYEAVMKYPVTGQLFSEIQADRIIKLKANEYSDLQLFRIYKPSKPLNGIVTFNAQHISYDLNINPVAPFTSNNVNANAAISDILDNCCFQHRFTSVSDIETISKISIDTPVSVRNCLGGMKGSVLDVFGGEYEFDNFTIKLHKHRGIDNGVTIEYGKNLTDLMVETDISNTYTSIMPYAKSNENVITLPEKIIQLDSSNIFGCARCKIMDFSSYFDQGEVINSTKLREKAKNYINSNNIDRIKTSIKVSFVHLWQSKEYEKYALLERVKICDTVSVKHQALGVSIKTKVIKTVYDTLVERYQSLELGEAKSNFASSLNNIDSEIGSLGSLINEQPSIMEKAINNATDIITGQKGGNVVQNPRDYPQEILIMDNQDIEKAVKLWRWNLGGLGYSNSGYNGKFTTAITMDGAIVADFITVGTLNANLIKAGVLQGIKIIAEEGSIAGWKMDNGVLVSDDGTMRIDSRTNQITIYDSDGNRLMTNDKNGLRFWRNDTEIGSIAVTKGANSETYGLSFNLKNGDAMTWSVYDDESGFYLNKLRYEKDTKTLKVSGNLELNGDIVNGNIVEGISTNGYKPVTGEFWAIKSMQTNTDGRITSLTTGNVKVENGLIVSW